jgi:hypothetical protein
VPDDCCSGFCTEDPVAGAFVCHPGGIPPGASSCTANADCPAATPIGAGLPTVNPGVCQAAVCSAGADCCEGVCWNGICESPPSPCVGLGGQCQSSADCCNAVRLLGTCRLGSG